MNQRAVFLTALPPGHVDRVRQSFAVHEIAAVTFILSGSNLPPRLVFESSSTNQWAVFLTVLPPGHVCRSCGTIACSTHLSRNTKQHTHLFNLHFRVFHLQVHSLPLFSFSIRHLDSSTPLVSSAIILFLLHSSSASGSLAVTAQRKSSSMSSRNLCRSSRSSSMSTRGPPLSANQVHHELSWVSPSGSPHHSNGAHTD